MQAELGHYFLEGFRQSDSPRTESPPQLTEDEATEVERPASAVLLAPPPAPLEKCAVAALASGSGDSQVLMIDSLQGARQEIQVDAAPEQGDLEAEVSDRDAILQSDDEALLLGEVVDGTVRTRKRTDAGFDSDSGSETPCTAEAPLEASPSPPGGEDPLPQMPIPLPQMPGVNLQPMLARANSSTISGVNLEGKIGVLPMLLPQLPPSEEYLEEIDQQIESLLERFFNDATSWSSIEQQAASVARSLESSKVPPGDVQYFRIKVPSPYPGVQYRRSMRLDDRYGHYAKQGQVVEGVVDGQWLRISGSIFLPLTASLPDPEVGFVSILEPITKKERDQERAARANSGAGESPSSFQAIPFDLEEGGPRTVTARALPEAICTAPLQDPDALSEFCKQNPINAFGDTPRASRCASPQSGAQVSMRDVMSS